MPTGGGKSLCYQVRQNQLCQHMRLNTVSFMSLRCCFASLLISVWCHVQLPAVVNKGLTLVISPLLSLMQDQASSTVAVCSACIPDQCTGNHHCLVSDAVVRRIASETGLVTGRPSRAIVPTKLVSCICLSDTHWNDRQAVI